MTEQFKDQDAFMDWARERNPGEEEFLSALESILGCVWQVVEENEDYRAARVLERLAEPERVISFRVCWDGDDGQFHVNRGWRVEHCAAIGPYKGGTRFHPSVSQSLFKMLALEQTLKNALTDLPIGGAKGGADFDPTGRSAHEIRRFCQSYMTELWRHIGPDTDIPAGDINVGEREIGFMFGQYRRLANRFDGALTGKGLDYGGSPLRTEATGYGLIYFLRLMLTQHDERLAGKRLAISGAGTVALHAAEKATELGAKVVALSDSGGALHYADGLAADHIDWIKNHKKKPGASLAEFTDEAGGDWQEGEKPWHFECDIALPCATQHEIDATEAGSLTGNGCMALAEGANMPCTGEAIDKLRDCGLLYAPGKAANAGGVATSQLEMRQNASLRPLARSEVDAMLQNIMDRIHVTCVRHGEADGRIDYVRGANVAGFCRVADALVAQGTV